jgi:DNA polymerase-3 subunit alpha
MAQQKGEFVDGSVKKGIDRKIAEQVFDMIETFARYGFVKAHSTGYAIIAYQTAYLKAHYPAEFLAAALTSEMGNSTRVNVFRNECKELGIGLMPPDINKGLVHFNVVDGKIVFSLAAVKNVGHSAVESIVTARDKDGEFSDIFDFCTRIDLRLANKKALESLVQCGAFDSLEPNRARLFNNVENLINYGAKMQRDAESGQSSLFGGDSPVDTMKPNLAEAESWSDAETRDREKGVLGFYLSSHPLEDNKLEYQAFAEYKLEELADLKDGVKVFVGGVVSEVDIRISRSNNQYGRITIEDFTDAVQVLVFSPCFENRKNILVEGNNIFVVGTLNTKEGEKPTIVADDVLDMKIASKEIKGRVHLLIDEAKLSDTVIKDLDDAFKQNKGELEIVFHFKSNGTELISKTRKYRIEPTSKFLAELTDKFGANCVKVEIAKPANNNNNGRGGRWKKQNSY